MNRYFFIFFLILFPFGRLLAQIRKPIVDSIAFYKWPKASAPAISENGEYVIYSITGRRMNELFIRSIETGWKVKLSGATACHFSKDSQKAYFQQGDTLFTITLGKDKAEQVALVRSVSYPSAEETEWLSFQPKARQGEIVLMNMATGQQMVFQSINSLRWESSGKYAALISRENGKTSLSVLELPGRKFKEIWSTKDSVSMSMLGNMIRFSDLGDQLAFNLISYNQNQPSTSIWCYRKGTDAAVKLADDQNLNLSGRFIINSHSLQFSRNGHWLFFSLQEPQKEKSKSTTEGAQVDIYSYKDLKLQGEQLNRINDEKQQCQAIVPVTGGLVTMLNGLIDGESRLFTNPKSVTGDYVVLGERLHENFKPWWLAYTDAYTYYIISLKDGKRTLLHRESKYPVSDFSFSPDGKQLVYWDSRQSGYMSYDVVSGKTINLTSQVPEIAKEAGYVYLFGNSVFSQQVDNVDNVKWIGDGKFLLIYSMYDIWKVDPTGKIAPVNLTKDFGSKRHILLRLVDGNTNYTGDEQVLVTGFNSNTKDNGFYRISLAHPNSPALLTIGPYCYYRKSSQVPQTSDSFSANMKPVKAQNANAWIVSRETANEYPNYFYTSDWKKFTPLTDLQPQRDYNWLTSELITYKQVDGTTSQGILYKPENFDPKKKYPVIFNYYERLSSRLHEFPKPGYTDDNINIPWFVSRGYLVFTPDIHYTVASKKKGKTVGEAACNSVLGAAHYLSKLPYVDGKHMGIQGHSFGGGETNFLVTHSTFFAAACSAGGTVSDQVSAYLDPYRLIGRNPISYRVVHSENGHEMIGATLWERPDLYFRSSSVFNANKVTTPLLLMHNERDEQTDWGQSFELYTALRRLGKPVWLLQYDGEGHSLYKETNQKDFTIRLTQFFDHYLKDSPAPKWMVQGIPAIMKGIDEGYELIPGAKP